jgi:hypothetical protein
MMICADISAQLVFFSIPENFQLIPRDKNNTGTFNVSGKSSSTEFYRIRSTVTDDKGAVLEEKITTIDPSAGTFEVTHHLNAALTEYELKIFLGNSTEEFLYRKVTNLVCGDVFLIAGQSNAVAHLLPDDGGNAHNIANYNPYCRAMGFCMDFALQNSISMEWEYIFSRPTCVGLELGFAGTWGIQLQNNISRITGVPVCIVNGARSGSSVAFNLPTLIPSDPGTLNENIPYDRIFKKLKKYGYDKSLKAIFWYQGETDAAYSHPEVLGYTERFKTLYKAWKTDYVSLEKIFVMQINTGCGGEYNGLIAEEQRAIGTLKDVVLMSTVGSDTSERNKDGCHYTKKGYSKLGDKLLPVTLANIYGYNYYNDSILPPMVKYSYTSEHNQICIEFDKNITLQEYTCYGKDTAFLKDHFFGRDYSRLDIKSLSVKENKLYLNFKDNFSLPEVISYVPNNFSSAQTTYAGPWIMNYNGKLGAFSFNECKVNSYVSEIRNSITEGGITVFPNPSKGFFKIVIRYTNLKENKITLLDLCNRKLQEETTTQSNYTLDLNNIPTGVYLLKVSNSNGTYMKKVVVE